MGQLRIPAVIMRGGTSKGVFFHGGDLPPPGDALDRLLLAALGSPDPYLKQLDGLGGATSSTSKAVIVTPSSRPDADVDYLFAQIAIGEPIVDYSGNCGNLASAVGPFAIEEGLVAAAGAVTPVRIWQVNTGRRIVAHCPTREGLPRVTGDFALAGVRRTGAEIRLEFIDPGPTSCGDLFPTGRLVDHLEIPGIGTIRVTLIDAGTPLVLVRASDLDLRGTESATELNGDIRLLARLEAIRGHGSVAMGLAEDVEAASCARPATPKIAVLAEPEDYVASTGDRVSAGHYEVSARVVSMGKLHHAIPVTAAIGIGVATAVPGTLAHAAARRSMGHPPLIRLGHPAGITDVEAVVRREDGRWAAERATISRTARRIMEGFVRIPAADVTGWAAAR